MFWKDSVMGDSADSAKLSSMGIIAYWSKGECRIQVHRLSWHFVPPNGKFWHQTHWETKMDSGIFKSRMSTESQ